MMELLERMTIMPVLDPKDGDGENFLVERLQELLLALGTLLQKFEQLLPPGNGPVPRSSPDNDWVIRLLLVILVVLSLASLIFYAFFRGGAFGSGGWGATKMLKPPQGGGPPTVYEHECIVSAIAMLIVIVFSLGGLYYYYCRQAGCFGDGMHATRVTMNNPGRKVLVMSK